MRRFRPLALGPALTLALLLLPTPRPADAIERRVFTGSIATAFWSATLDDCTQQFVYVQGLAIAGTDYPGGVNEVAVVETTYDACLGESTFRQGNTSTGTPFALEGHLRVATARTVVSMCGIEPPCEDAVVDLVWTGTGEIAPSFTNTLIISGPLTHHQLTRGIGRDASVDGTLELSGLDLTRGTWEFAFLGENWMRTVQR